VAIEQFAVENLNEHRKGFLGKAVPIGNMLTWTKVTTSVVSSHSLMSFFDMQSAILLTGN